jgi:sigma-E factor negative regulatory protein RseB
MARFPLLMATCVVLIAVPPAPTFAAGDDAVALLHKVASAANQLTYSGVFVYRNGGREETSRIVHTVEDGKQRERIEVLDGSPREVVRDGQEVRCFLPEQKLLVVESESRRRGFPAVFSLGSANVGDSYSVRRGESGRVAGIDSQTLRVEPRDSYRYGHEISIDPVSGLLLKASLLGDHGEILESFAFTQVTIGKPLERDALAPKFEGMKPNIRRVSASEVRPEELAWVFRQAIPGFRKISAMRRPTPHGEADSVHVVFSDGLAAISVFIEPVKVAEGDSVVSRMGAMHVYRRSVHDHQLVVMGEVPAAAVKRLGDGIERKVR